MKFSRLLFIVALASIASTLSAQQKSTTPNVTIDDFDKAHQGVFTDQNNDKAAEASRLTSSFATPGTPIPGEVPRKNYIDEAIFGRIDRDRIPHATLASDQERLEGDPSNRSAAFRQAVAPITIEGVHQGLPADAVLVEWFRNQPVDLKAKDEKTKFGAPHYVAYVLRREGEPAAIDLGAAQDIDFRAALSNPARIDYKEAAQALFGKLTAPVTSTFVSET